MIFQSIHDAACVSNCIKESHLQVLSLISDDLSSDGCGQDQNAGGVLYVSPMTVP